MKTETLDLIEKIKLIDKWLRRVAFDYIIRKITNCNNAGYEFLIEEINLDYSYTRYTLTIDKDNRILNENSEDLIDVAKTAYDNEPEIIEWLNNFYNEN